MALEEKPESYNEDEFNDMVIGFDDLIAEVRVMLGRVKRSQPEATEQKQEVSAARLPNIKLPNFSGIIEEWISFISLFNLLVGQNTTISKVEKLQYLRLSLQGEPLELIRGMDLTDENYGIAVRLLQDRYENIRKIAVSHADKLLNFPVSQYPSAKHMRNLIASYREHVEALRSLKILNSESSGTTNGLFLFLILVRKLDRETKCQFERTLDSSKDIPTPETLIDFLEREAQALEASEDKSRVDANRKAVSTRTTVLVTQHAKKCACCDKQADHPLYRCKSFVQLSVVDRKQFIQQQRLCFICFGDHLAGKCQSSRRCVKCNGKHHTMIHTGGPSTVHTSVKSSIPLSKPVDEAGVPLYKDAEASTEALTASFAERRDGVLLSTALIGVRTGTGHIELVRALYDTGSQASYITTYCARRLKLDFQHQNVRVFGLARRDVVVKASVSLHMSNRRDSKHILSTEAYVLDKITADLPVTPLQSELKNQVGDIFLADPEFEVPAPIDCLLGADVFARVLIDGRMELGPGRPILINTRFGWILMGSTALASSHRKETLLVSCTAIVEDHLDQMLRRFWSMEEPPQKNAAPPDSRAGEHFASTHSRDSNGKYIVRLPFKNTELTLGESRQMAESRFFSLERRFTRSPELLALYKDFMQEYEEVGHMELIPDQSVATSGPVRYYYMPHHAVIKPSSSTTKLRVVFDASAKTTSQSQCSLNDLLLSGPKLQKDITEVLLRFRTHAVAFTADVKQMFRNVWIHPDNQRYQLILWRDSADQPLRTYQLNTVTFGVTSSPYLAMKTILQLTQDEEEAFPRATAVLRSDVYVDDVVTGADSLEEALAIRGELIGLLGKAGFQLRKWTSNNTGMLSSMAKGLRDVPLCFSGPEGPVFTVLGMGWMSEADNFVFTLNLKDITPTKRGILSCMAQIYDPMGYLSPVTLWIKVLIKDLWSRGLVWDEVLPEDLKPKWKLFSGELVKLREVVVPRFLGAKHGFIHGFADASETGYAAVVYFHPVSTAHGPPILLIARAKVSPLKRVSIPRLELCGDHLLSRLLKFCLDTLQPLVEVIDVFAWTDSTVVLSWIHTSSHLLKTFVSNRISDIQSWITPSKWRHVPSLNNPADPASRGLYPGMLATSTMWFSGPKFLLEPMPEWPARKEFTLDKEHDSERKLCPLQVLTAIEKVSDMNHLWNGISSWPKLIRVMAYVLRFVYNCLNTNSRREGVLSLSELRIATMSVLKLVQHDSLKHELRALERGEMCSTGVQRLAPFVDPAGLLRVGGRLKYANVAFRVKHPILLRGDHHVTALLIDYLHVLYLHAGPQLLQSMMVRKYWLLSGRAAIRKRLYRCVICFRNKPRNSPPLIADLPDVRVNPARVFSSVSLDFAGPFLGKSHRRSKARCKLYICIIVCCTTKAVHLETVSALTTDAFLAAFQRFVARRGIPLHVFSDQGTNFVGADAELRKIYKYWNSVLKGEELARFAVQSDITWHFQPPAAPHFGGLHEAAVKQMKHHLKRVMGNQLLTYEELATLSARIEAVLNSRPLCPLSNDPTEFDALTPGHFLIGAPLLSLPDPRPDTNSNLRLRWRLVQDMGLQFWKRWHAEYLHTLVQRSKWYKSSSNLQNGTLVIVQDDNLPPQAWRMARIVSAKASKDGVVRVVRLRTASGDLTRPAVKVFPFLFFNYSVGITTLRSVCVGSVGLCRFGRSAFKDYS